MSLLLRSITLKTFYTVDRLHRLHQGMIIDLHKREKITPPTLEDHVARLFPEGVSEHGKIYFLGSEARGNVTNSSIELLFEYVRQSHFPELTSRFQSFFAWEGLSDAKKFKSLYASNGAKIWEVTTEQAYFIGNMRLLDSNQTNLYYSYFAHQYWSGNSGPPELPGTLWEALLSLPVTIGRQIG